MGTPRRLVAGAAAAALTLSLAGCTPTAPVVGPGPDARTEAPPTTLDFNAGRSDPVRDPVYPDQGNPALDVLAYQLALEWTPPTGQLAGTARLTIRTTTAVDALSLEFSHAYTVDGVTVDGEAATSSWAGDDIVVPVHRAADEQTTLIVRYHGRPQTVPMPSQRTDFDEGLGLRAD